MLNDTIALEHEKVEFCVKVLGTPKPSVQWFKDDMEVFSSDRLEIKVNSLIRENISMVLLHRLRRMVEV